MIILIGGESLTGKTLMAHRLLEIYKIPYLSADHIKMGLYKADNHCGFTPEDSNEIIEKSLWPILKGVIETNIENGQSIIIEGCYCSPYRINEFSSEQRNYVIPVFMGFSKKYLVNHFLSGVLKYRNTAERRKKAEDRTLEWFIEANERIKAMCAEHGIRYFEIDADYDEDTKAVYHFIAAEALKLASLEGAQ